MKTVQNEKWNHNNESNAVWWLKNMVIIYTLSRLVRLPRLIV